MKTKALGIGLGVAIAGVFWAGLTFLMLGGAP